MKAKEIGIWGAVIVVLIGGLWLLINAVNSSPSPSTPLEVKNLPAVSKEDFVRGNPNAKVTLIEYADFQCPACGVAYPQVKKFEEDFKNDLKVIYRFFPLTNTHQNSLISSQAAYAASLQGKFWEMHDMLFENQSGWSDSKDAKSIFIGYATKLGLDLKKFESDITSDSSTKFIMDEENKGLSVGINSTPTFFINGKQAQIVGSFDELRKVIQDEINKK